MFGKESSFTFDKHLQQVICQRRGQLVITLQFTFPRIVTEQGIFAKQRLRCVPCVILLRWQPGIRDRFMDDLLYQNQNQKDFSVTMKNINKEPLTTTTTTKTINPVEMAERHKQLFSLELCQLLRTQGYSETKRKKGCLPVPNRQKSVCY